MDETKETISSSASPTSIKHFFLHPCLWKHFLFVWVFVLYLVGRWKSVLLLYLRNVSSFVRAVLLYWRWSGTRVVVGSRRIKFSFKFMWRSSAQNLRNVNWDDLELLVASNYCCKLFMVKLSHTFTWNLIFWLLCSTELYNEAFYEFFSNLHESLLFL